MKISVPHIAKLANLFIPKEEEKKLEKQLEETISYISNLNEIDTASVKETGNIIGLTNVFRDDEPSPSLPQGKALLNSKSTINGFFKVKGILDNE